MSGTPVCIDASFVLHLVSGGELTTAAIGRWAAWHQAGRAVVAPVLLHYEVSGALWRYVERRELLAEEAIEALEAALDLQIELRSDPELLRRALGIADRLRLPAPEWAHYLAVAEQLGGELWTADGRLVSAVQAVLPWVHLLGD